MLGTCGTISIATVFPFMSRAFVKEPDGAEAFEGLPDRPISPHPNLVSRHGLAQIEETLARLHAEHARAQAAGDRAALASVGRDLRYWMARRSSAQEMPEPSGNATVQFGSTVTILRDDGRRQTFRIVGEDEAEPSRGTLSCVSPVARALMNKAVGDVIAAGGGEAEIVAIGGGQDGGG
jgi:transcription elongation GreA/GreB family factor